MPLTLWYHNMDKDFPAYTDSQYHTNKAITYINQAMHELSAVIHLADEKHKQVLNPLIKSLNQISADFIALSKN